MSSFPSLPLFTDAYIADTAHLTNDEHGAYLRLLIFAWRSPQCRLPNDDVRLARMLGLTAGKWAKIKPAVMGFWTLVDDHWTQKRLAKEHAFLEKKYEQKRINGAQGGRPKSLKNQEPAKAKGSEIKTETKAPTPTPINTPIVPKGTGLAKEPEGFAEWWAEYPKRFGTNSRAAALDRYRQVLKEGTPPETLLRAVRTYAAEMRRAGKIHTEYVKQAAAFLSAKERHWEDYARRSEPKTAQDGRTGGFLERMTDDQWRDYVGRWRSRGGDWQALGKLTPPPDDPRTAVPAHILAEFNIHFARAA